jgi:hypothetical protein
MGLEASAHSHHLQRYHTLPVVDVNHPGTYEKHLYWVLNKEQRLEEERERNSMLELAACVFQPNGTSSRDTVKVQKAWSPATRELRTYKARFEGIKSNSIKNIYEGPTNIQKRISSKE